MSTLTNSSGQFVFCPLPSGTYDVVIVGQSTAGVVYSPTVVTGVSTGSAMTVVPLHALPVVSVAAAKVEGSGTSQHSANQPSGGVLNCSPNELMSTAVTPVAGVTSPVSTLAFVKCQ